MCSDLCFWNDTFWLVYDRTSAHSAPDGVVVLMRSADLRRWDEVAVFKTPYDARDAKLAATDDEPLCLLRQQSLRNRRRKGPPGRPFLRLGFERRLSVVDPNANMRPKLLAVARARARRNLLLRREGRRAAFQPQWPRLADDFADSRERGRKPTAAAGDPRSGPSHHAAL